LPIQNQLAYSFCTGREKEGKLFQIIEYPSPAEPVSAIRKFLIHVYYVLMQQNLVGIVG